MTKDANIVLYIKQITYENTTFFRNYIFLLVFIFTACGDKDDVEHVGSFPVIFAIDSQKDGTLSYTASKKIDDIAYIEEHGDVKYVEVKSAELYITSNYFVPGDEIKSITIEVKDSDIEKFKYVAQQDGLLIVTESATEFNIKNASLNAFVEKLTNYTFSKGNAEVVFSVTTNLSESKSIYIRFDNSIRFFYK